MRDLDNIDLAIHRMIAAWAIKHKVLVTGDALDELEHDLLRPVFEQRDAAVAACRAAIATLESWPPAEWGYREQKIHEILITTTSAPAPGENKKWQSRD